MHHEQSLQFFNELIEAGVCREQARGVLPQNMYTIYVCSANLNNILKFIDLRTHEGAQWEIQEMAKAMLEIISKLYPVTVAAYKEVKE
jgi:thymidylate synthase (FAD)